MFLTEPAGKRGLALLLLAGRVLGDVGFIHNFTAYQAGDYGVEPTQHYKSSHIPSPFFAVTRWNESLIDPTPYIFMNLEYGTSQGNRGGPYIFDSRDLSMVYGNPNFTASNNARIQPYKDTTLLTFWEGKQGKGHAEGHCVMMNQRYEVVYNISTVGLNTQVDLHECEITQDNTVLITAYESIEYDLTSVGGKVDDLLLDSVFQEIDIETNELLFSWRGSDHIPVAESFKPYAAKENIGWDAYHINSLQKNNDGNYFVSFRRNHLLTLVNGTDGSLIWQLGGRNNDFRDLSDGRATDIAWQHHARFWDDAWTQLTVFDNHELKWDDAVGCTGPECSRGVSLELDYKEMTVRVKQEYFSPNGIGAYAMGGYDQLANGNALIGWGSMASFSEYTPEGECVMDVLFGQLDTWVRTYRVYKAAWKADPPWPPAIAATTGSKSQVHVSWNGATEVRSWAVMASNVTQRLTHFGHLDTMHDDIVKSVARSGFETDIPLETTDRFVRVVALDSDGAVLGATGIVDMQSGDVKDVDTELGDRFMLEYPHHRG